jgi:serine/threonine protein kinase
MNITEQNALTIPSQYLPISVAGSGAQGSVYFCLPKSSIPTTHSLSKANFVALKKQVLAVKITCKVDPCAAEDAAKEIAVLEKISTLIPAELRGQFVTLLDAGEEFNNEGEWLYSWMALHALHPVITLETFRHAIKNDESASDALAAHFFLQIGSALMFLHNVVGVMHTDLHDHNILIDTQSPPSNGFPNFVMIDFGCATATSEYSHYPHLEDPCSLHHEVCALMSSGIAADKRAAHDVEWTKFRNLLVGVEAAQCMDLELEELWGRVAGLARKVVGKVTEEEVERIQRVIEMMVQMAKQSVSDDDLKVALEFM